jgi:TM2 domain-containing membrane protein YozV
MLVLSLHNLTNNYFFTKYLLLLLCLLLGGYTVQATIATAPMVSTLSPAIAGISELPANVTSLSPEDFLSMTPAKFKATIGRKMKFKEVMAMKSAQKAVKKRMGIGGSGDGKSQLVALLLAIFLGVLGVYRFYLGYTGVGIIQLLTAGGCGIWYIIDIIMIAVGDLKPKNGDDYETTL